MSALREPLSERRLKMVFKVFGFFDRNGEKMVELEDLCTFFLSNLFF